MQIFVASAADGYETESYLTFYDIFVRNAFGSIFDVLREVSYSPLMGSYLSYRGNEAVAVGRSFPDENFAREVMQLFTIDGQGAASVAEALAEQAGTIEELITEFVANRTYYKRKEDLENNEDDEDKEEDENRAKKLHNTMNGITEPTDSDA